MWTGSDRPGAEQHFFDRSELCMILPLKRVAFLTRLISSEIATAPEVKCPVYIVHGTNDEVISYSHAEDLVRNCQEGKSQKARSAGKATVALGTASPGM